MKSMKISHLILLLVAVLLMSGCAVGNRYNYAGVVAEMNASGTSTVGVATHDQREYVKSGNKTPDFVGLQRGGFGNPFDVTTDNGLSLAENMTMAISNSLKAKGFNTIPVIVSHTDNHDQVIQKLEAAKGHKTVFLTLQEWKTDAAFNVSLRYDLTFKVLDGMGEVIVSKPFSAREKNLGRIGFSPETEGNAAAAVAFKNTLEMIFNDPEILEALK